MLLSYGQCGAVHALVDLLTLLRLEGVETFSCITHPVGTGHGMSPRSSSQRMTNKTHPRWQVVQLPILLELCLCPFMVSSSSKPHLLGTSHGHHLSLRHVLW